MKKKLIGATLLATALTLSTGITSFAGWVTDKDGTRYQKEDGTYQGWGWFTDPDTGLEYYFDLGGYVMTHTHVEGYWLDDDGVKQEKTEAQLAAEEARAAREKTSHNPGNTAREAKEEAKASAEGHLANSTRRNVYQQEMNIFANRAFVNVKKALAADNNKSYSGDVTEDNQQSTYYYDTSSATRVIYATLWKNSTKSSRYYVPYAVELNYNRNVIHGSESEYFDEAFKYMVIAALGENKGNAVYEKVMAFEVGSDDTLKESGTTDTGNTYELTYRYNNANVKITCSEIVPEGEETETVEDTTEETIQESTTSVITAGAAASADNTDETAETEVDEETEASEETETEGAAETAE